MQTTIEEKYTIRSSNKDSILCVTLYIVIRIQTSSCYRLGIVCGGRVREF